MLIRIHTENKNRNWIESLIGLHFPNGFSISEQIGHWKGGFEKSLCIEIDTPIIHRGYNSQLVNVIRELKEHNAQEAVLVQEIKSDSYLA